ncbi:hypothetical protein [Chondromyces apiculatus]|uniref:hypothetical protein n=1 Tax=Chondromyces apiculatus TaxID=51 RepID=UPI0005C4D231|nr:hypothetical protein [Chondromyces apiculatus]
MPNDRSQSEIKKEAAREAAAGASGKMGKTDAEGGQIEGSEQTANKRAQVAPAVVEPQDKHEDAADLQPFTPGGVPRTAEEKQGQVPSPARRAPAPGTSR